MKSRDFGDVEWVGKCMEHRRRGKVGSWGYWGQCFLSVSFLAFFPEGKKNPRQKLMVPTHLSSAHLKSPVQLNGKFPCRGMAKPVKHHIFLCLMLGAHYSVGRPVVSWS